MRTMSYVFANGFTTKDYAEAEAAKAKLGNYTIKLDDVVEVPLHIQKKRKALGIE